MQRVSVIQNHDLFKARAEEFVGWAKAGDVEKMLLHTSPKTLKNSKTEKVRKVYKDEVIPSFAHTTVNWDPRGKTSRDLQGNTGYIFSGYASGKSSFRFEIAIFGEGGELVVVNMRKK